MPAVRCTHCGTAIPARAALLVGGRTLRPFHAACYATHAAEQPWYRRPGWPVNRWRALVPVNALLVVILAALHYGVEPLPAPPWLAAGGLVLVANGWLLLARLVSYRAYERHLPPGAPTDSLPRRTAGPAA